MRPLVTLRTMSAGTMVAAVAALASLHLASEARASTPSFRDADGIHVVSVREVDPRLDALVVKTPALPAPANVYILFPPGYASHPTRRYPVFYLLHGTSGTASDWTVMGHAQQVIGERPVITVMPDIALGNGGGGWCTDWPNGAQRWETFHIDQLLPWVDANLRTIPNRAERAIAGLSQGGFCSLSYAARHPDLFSVALGYSGAPDIWYDPEARAGAEAVINATEVGLDHVPPNTFFGDPITDGINWAAHDPATLAPNLRATKLYMYWGNGQPGPYDTLPPNTSAEGIETLVWHDNNDFAARLRSLRIPAVEDDYGPGTHSWPYWTRDLSWSIDRIMRDFAHPASQPASIAYASADDSYAVYGWTVATHRTAREFSTLKHATARGFALAGTGSATVLTPARYVPHARYRVTLSGDRVPGHAVTLVAGRDRRLRIEVPLGPPDPYQEYTTQAQTFGSSMYTTAVRIVRR